MSKIIHREKQRELEQRILGALKGAGKIESEEIKARIDRFNWFRDEEISAVMEKLINEGKIIRWEYKRPLRHAYCIPDRF
ncbi:MAG: hypothetical protein WC926_02600 [Candidatus Paceibacterota bacterium]